nr:MAG TPA: hypothetical protein [Caudoviricetes sp.]
MKPFRLISRGFFVILVDLLFKLIYNMNIR